jgi:hypothetical protein
MNRNDMKRMQLFYDENGYSPKGFVPVIYDRTFPKGNVETLKKEPVILCMYYNTDFGIDVLKNISKMGENTRGYNAGFILYLKDGSFLTHRSEGVSKGFSLVQFMMGSFLGDKLSHLVIGVGGKGFNLFPRRSTCKKGEYLYVGDGNGQTIGLYTDKRFTPAVYFRGDFLIQEKKGYTRMFHSTWDV